MWLAFKDGEVKFLANKLGYDCINEFTRSAISDYIVGLGLE